MEENPKTNVKILQQEENKEIINDPVYENLRKSKFKQNTVSAWRPKPTVLSTTITFLCFGIIFIFIGVLVLYYSKKIIEITLENDNDKSSINFSINNTLKQPILFFYQLENFYQNHRQYIGSKCKEQFSGKKVDDKICKKMCDNLSTNSQMGKKRNYNNSTELKDEDIAIPCGLMAKSFFNEKYKLYYNSNIEITINETGIAWDSDRKKMYKNSENKSKQWQDMEDEHFIVWMRPAGFGTFRKLWGRINEELKIGNYTINITNKYNNPDFEGTKKIVLSTINIFGGKNEFLGYCYVIVGSLCIFIAIIFFLGFKIYQRRKEE